MKLCHQSSFVINWVLSQFAFLSFATICVLEFWHNLRFVTLWVLSQFEYSSFVTICLNLNFLVLSQFEILSFATICDFDNQKISQKYFMMKKIVSQFFRHHNLSFSVLSQIKFYCHYCHYCHYYHYCHYCQYWVIPYKSTEKNMTIFFLNFWPKKSKVFDILVIKNVF